MKMKTREVLRQVPWLGVVLILLVGVIASGAIVYARRPAEETEETVYHTVRFLDSDGTLIEEKQVAHGDAAIPPEMESTADGIVFDGWSKMLYSVGDSADVQPIYRDMREEKNTLYLDAAYGQLGETINAKIWLGGQVCLSGMELTIVYDPEVLEAFTCDPSSPFEVTETSEGSIKLRMAESENCTEAFCVANISYKISDNSSNIAKTKIRLEMKNPKVIRDGGEHGTDGNAVHGIVYPLS